jgi:hypothetical protein
MTCSISPIHKTHPRRALFNEALKAHLIEELDHSFVLFDDTHAAGICSFGKEGEEGLLSIWFDPDTDLQTRCHLFGIIDERMVRMLHPDAIISYTDDPLTRKAMRGSLYFPKGKYMKRPIEEWRQKLPDRCFDDGGYLINQGLMKDLPFGWFDTREKGCGWIAAYNLLKWAGKEGFLEETARDLAEHALLGEVTGENIINLYSYLKRHGLDLKMRTGLSSSLIHKMEQSQAGILLFNHTYGSHYAAYERIDDRRYHFWNAVYGKQNDIITMDKFQKERVLWPLGTVLYLL